MLPAAWRVRPGGHVGRARLPSMSDAGLDCAQLGRTRTASYPPPPHGFEREGNSDRLSAERAWPVLPRHWPRVHDGTFALSYASPAVHRPRGCHVVFVHAEPVPPRATLSGPQLPTVPSPLPVGLPVAGQNRGNA